MTATCWAPARSTPRSRQRTLGAPGEQVARERLGREAGRGWTATAHPSPGGTRAGRARPVRGAQKDHHGGEHSVGGPSVGLRQFSQPSQACPVGPGVEEHGDPAVPVTGGPSHRGRARAAHPDGHGSEAGSWRYPGLALPTGPAAVAQASGASEGGVHRGPLVAKSTPAASYSPGWLPTPTPRTNRPPERICNDEACFATAASSPQRQLQDAGADRPSGGGRRHRHGREALHGRTGPVQVVAGPQCPAPRASAAGRWRRRRVAAWSAPPPVPTIGSTFVTGSFPLWEGRQDQPEGSPVHLRVAPPPFGDPKPASWASAHRCGSVVPLVLPGGYLKISRGIGRAPVPGAGVTKSGERRYARRG